ncbi:MAG: cold shock domain-containing protein [Rhodanobacter sp.]
MRTHGTLTKWNDDRGFGFIKPATDTEELFVHISAFARDGARPRIGELVSFEIEPRPDGKHRAVRIMRPGSRAASYRAHRRPSSSTRCSPFLALVGVLVIAAIGGYGYTQLSNSRLSAPVRAAATFPSIPASPAQTFSCDGRTRCSQMTSCAEANFFVKRCPGTQMDGDGDGVACESQWCTGGGSR